MRYQAQPARRWRRLLLVVAVATVGMIVPSLVAGTPAYASAGPRCGTGSSSGNVNTCITIKGTGEHVDWILASAQVSQSTRNLQICIHGPNGSIQCNPANGYHSTGPGEEISTTWSPNAQEPSGDYCANTWRLNSDGSNTEIGHECLNVHL
jgi:hypothetical protein